MADANVTDEWTTNATKATQIEMVRPSTDSSTLESLYRFNPAFTYPIFGTNEEFWGYKDIKVRLQFSAHNCIPHMSFDYGMKFKSIADVAPDDVNAKIADFLPESAFESGYNRRILSDNNAKSWTPPGKIAHSYSRKGRNYEIWTDYLTNPRMRELITNMQIFVSFFIEGGQPLPVNTDPYWALERWKVFLVYEKTSVTDRTNISPYVLCGYATTWRFHTFVAPKIRPHASRITTLEELESIEPVKQPCRYQISQFLLLPPHQGSGHGSVLYNLIYKEAHADLAVLEMTVEDPSEEFDRLRDINDFKTLHPIFEKADIKLTFSELEKRHKFDMSPWKHLTDWKKLEEIRVSAKIQRRQFQRMVEMYLYSIIPFGHRDPLGKNTAANTKLLINKHKTKDINDRTYYWWRILMRSRIYRQNADILQTHLSPEELQKYIIETGRGQQDEYELMLVQMATKEMKGQGIDINDLDGSDVLNKASDDNAGRSLVSRSGGKRSASGLKRKTVIEDDDDDEDEDEQSGPSVKKSKQNST